MASSALQDIRDSEGAQDMDDQVELPRAMHAEANASRVAPHNMRRDEVDKLRNSRDQVNKLGSGCETYRRFEFGLK